MSTDTEKPKYSGTPEEILGLLKIDSQDYTLVRWTSGQAYVPYGYMKREHPDLLVQFYKQNAKFLKYQPRR